jgi:hypothetical protein
MVPAALGVAQSYPTFNVVTSKNSTDTFSGWTPRNLYAVDVNNDGIPDLIQDQYWSNSRGSDTQQPVFGVSIANGDGTFKAAAPYNYPPGWGGGPMAFGDFNGDGKIDIAMPAGNHTIAIYLGRGDGTFLNPWYSVVPLAASQFIATTSLVAADFNHDGKLDLAIVGTDSTSNTVYILPGEGNGLFSNAEKVLMVPGADNASGWGVQKMLLGDFDGDHNADLVVLASTGNSEGGFASFTVHVLYGDGAFNFEDTTPITSGNVVDMNSGDLNRDGRSDLFAIDGDSYRLDTYYGQTDRTFATYTQQLAPASYPGGAYYFAPSPSMADFNDDGHNDLVTITSSDSGLVYLIFFLGTSSPGQFTPHTWNVSNAKGSFIVPQVADFNHDGKPDWVFGANTFPGDSNFYTGLNDTAGGLWADCSYPTAARGVTFCSPAGNSGPTVNFNAAAHSFGQLRKIELWVDGKKLTEQYNTWAGNGFLNYSSNLPSGSHQGTFYAVDVDNSLQRHNFNFSVGPSSCSAPKSDGVHICAPVTGSATSVAPVLVQATATISGTLARMEIWVDGVKEYTETDSTSLAASLNLRPGTHQFTVYAVNTNGTLWDATVAAMVP